MLIERDRIWARACALLLDGSSELRAGDHALSAAILAHGLVMNAGVLHALQGMSPSERREAAAAFRFFMLPGLADLFERAVPDHDLDEDDEELDTELDELEAGLNAQYWAHAPDDGALRRAFHRRLEQEPQLFAPAP